MQFFVCGRGRRLVDGNVGIRKTEYTKITRVIKGFYRKDVETLRAPAILMGLRSIPVLWVRFGASLFSEVPSSEGKLETYSHGSLKKQAFTVPGS